MNKTALKTINEIQQQIVEEMDMIGDGFEQYSYLIELAMTLPDMNEQEMTDDHLVKGCQSAVWVAPRREGDLFFFDGNSDTLILKGILALLQELFNGQPLVDVANSDIWFFGQTELMVTFNNDRQKGIGYVIRTLQNWAQAAIAKAS